ncbi:MAG TPA: amino acid permease [Acidimicrobiales bacterium]|jgi:arginine:ornithine antiporter/lysine permease
MPRFLRRTNAAEAPVSALVMTTILIQAMLVVTLVSEDAFNFMLNMTSALTLIPFLLVALYAVKLVITRETYREQPAGFRRDVVVGVLATIYTTFLLYAAGPKYMLLSLIIYAPGTVLFVLSRREQDRTIFSPGELVIPAVSIIGAVVGVIGLATGSITI